MVWASAWNAGTCRPERFPGIRSGAEGALQEVVNLQGVDYRLRGTGEDRLAVAVMPGNAGGAKGTGHRGLN